ncbi:hypothetical protein NL676_000613 [Syzygium grande]|nr:hypothetical protein NL676_000613 [Syzygium grande]
MSHRLPPHATSSTAMCCSNKGKKRVLQREREGYRERQGLWGKKVEGGTELIAGHDGNGKATDLYGCRGSAPWAMEMNELDSGDRAEE